MSALAEFVALWEGLGRGREASLRPQGRFRDLLIAAYDLRLQGKTSGVKNLVTASELPSGTIRSWKNRSPELKQALVEVGSGIDEAAAFDIASERTLAGLSIHPQTPLSLG